MLRWRKDRKAWQVSVESGRDPLSGQRRRNTVLVRGGKREAKRVERELEAKVEAGRNLRVGASKLTIRDYLAHWLDVMRSRLAPETWRSYESKLRVNVLPTLGGIRLDRLHVVQIENLYERLGASGLSKLTVHHVHRVLSEALRHAVRYELIPRNPCDLLEVGLGERRVMTALSADQARLLLAACERADSMYADAVAITLLSGFRLGEVLALRWSSIDFQRGIIVVKASRQRQPGIGLADRPPKTASSRRSVPCGGYALGVLERVLARQRVVSIGDGLVFAGMTDTTLRRAFHRLLEAEGLPSIRFHDLRHSWATLFFNWGGADLKMASTHLGHSGIAVTADFYTHVPPAMQREAVHQFEGWLLDGNGAQMAHAE